MSVAQYDQLIEDIEHKVWTFDRKYDRAVRKCRLLKQRIDRMTEEYNGSDRLNQRSERDTLRRQIVTTEGRRIMFAKHARRLLDEIERMQDTLRAYRLLSDLAQASR